MDLVLHFLFLVCAGNAGFPRTATLQPIKAGERKLPFLDDSFHGLY